MKPIPGYQGFVKGFNSDPMKIGKPKNNLSYLNNVSMDVII